MQDIWQVRQAFATVLSERRSRKKWSQVELAGRCGLDNSYISQLEKGRKTPTLDVMLRVSNAFKIAPERLMKEIRLKISEMG